MGAPNALGFQIIPILFQMHTKNVKHEGIPWEARTYLSHKGPVETLSWLNLLSSLRLSDWAKSMRQQSRTGPKPKQCMSYVISGGNCQWAAGITLQTSHLSSVFSQGGLAGVIRFRERHKKFIGLSGKRRKTEWICILSQWLCNRNQTAGQQQIRTGSSSLSLCHNVVTQSSPVGSAWAHRGQW